ncbi:MAG: YbhB/YbcL family Raf kinase inhibitor-like protein [Candidatus Accumulibacter sp.]|uniref:YbhB/YbcL family Raf kinase inhibitor-like protein n=1 Tax=Accumulibacter sp. TaxID=2053492 RepID=UPI00287B47AA|nr:YbhB/YbcL family Raf kinase inhibitor-like protein [Accumulibacter sp.]MDS4014864.1 YbhB/YbcL family Raf kinase inhibitor-like protein [Accumulibacter sp.]
MKHISLGLTLALAALGVQAGDFTLVSPQIKPQGMINAQQVYNGFGCTGENVSPALEWKNPPPGTKSFAVLVHDPDAPTGGSGWWHWLVINLPAGASGLPLAAGKADGSALPAGAVQINTDFGGPGWGGPCPPVGDKAHRYHFTVYAMKLEKLELPAGASAALAGFMVNANSLGKATLTGLYARSK